MYLRSNFILTRSLRNLNLVKLISVNEMEQKNNDIYEKCKKNAAYQAVDENINTDSIVGVGSGSTITYVIERLATRCADKNLNVKCIPTSVKTKELILNHGLSLTNLEEYPLIDVAIDGADEVDEDFIAIKGGGACATQEKIVASVAKIFIIVADYRKNSQNLGDNWNRGIPIDVIPNAVNVVRHQISQIFDVPLDKILIRKDSSNKPILTDDGNYVIDWIFNKNKENILPPDWRTIAQRIKLLTGVVESGLFTDLVKLAYFGNEDGSVVKRTLPQT